MTDTAQVLKAIPEDTSSTEARDKFRTHTGILFQLRSVAPLLMMDAQKRIPAPVPPKVYLEDKETHEENPNDPAYRRELDAYARQIGEVANSILLTRGCEVLELPSDGSVKGPETTEWSDDISDMLGLDIPATGRRRFYCWMKYVALVNMTDFTNLINKISGLSGATQEADVAAAADNFRSDTQGDSPSGVPAVEGSGRGDSGGPIATGDGTGT